MSLRIKRRQKRKPNDVPGIAHYYTGNATVRLSNFVNELVSAMDEFSDNDLDKVERIIAIAERTLDSENVTDAQVDKIINKSIAILSHIEEPTINVLEPKIASDKSDATNLQELPKLKEEILHPATPLTMIDTISGKPGIIFDGPEHNLSVPAQHIQRVPSIYDGMSNGINDPRNISARNVTTPHSDIDIGERITEEYTGDREARGLSTIDQIERLRNPYHEEQNSWYNKFKHYAPSAATTLGVLGLVYLQNDPAAQIERFFPNGVQNDQKAIVHNNPLFDRYGFKDNPLYGKERSVAPIRETYLPQDLTKQDIRTFETPQAKYRVNVISGPN
jgi:hypothetical protein